MKKLTLLALVASMATFTACSKPVTEVKEGESAATAQETKTVSLSTDNKADIQSDLDKLQTYGASQEQKSQELGQRMEAAMQEKNKAEINKLFTELKAFVEKSNNELRAIELKSSEVNKLREKMIENSLISIEMSELMMQTDPEKLDIEKVKPLQEKAVKAQQELIAMSQEIYAKIDGTNGTAAQGAETAIPNAEVANTETAPAEVAQ